MQFNQNNLLVAKVASKDKFRVGLPIRSVKFTENVSVATDAFRLVEIAGVEGEGYQFVGMVDAGTIKKIKLDKNAVLTPEMIPLEAKIEGEFPKYEALFPEEKPAFEITVNGEYLAEVAEILAKLDKGTKQVRIKFYGDARKPIVMETVQAKQKGRALLMPIQD